jgi:predicted RNA-binding Zn ribbon-like protein
MSAAFDLVAGHAALDLVNTLDWRFREQGAEELLNSYGDLLRFAEQSKILTVGQVRRLRRSVSATTGLRVLESCTEFREALAEIFYSKLVGRSPSSTPCKTVERYFNAARQEQKLNWKQSPRLEWEWRTLESDATFPLLALAMSASDLMTSEAVDRVRACDNTECRWLFLDTSKNHTRRWCDMKLCGNRMKARRFKAHQFETHRVKTHREG